MNGQRDDVRAFVRDIGVRAAVVGVGGLIVTGSLAGLTLKGARGVVKRALGTTIAMTCGGVGAMESTENRKQEWAQPRSEPSPLEKRPPPPRPPTSPARPPRPTQ